MNTQRRTVCKVGSSWRWEEIVQSRLTISTRAHVRTARREYAARCRAVWSAERSDSPLRVTRLPRVIEDDRMHIPRSMHP